MCLKDSVPCVLSRIWERRHGTFVDFTVTNAVTLGALLVAKPVAIAAVVAGLLKSSRAPLFVKLFPQLCDFSHKALRVCGLFFFCL